jgi:hypothetical protein
MVYSGPGFSQLIGINLDPQKNRSTGRHRPPTRRRSRHNATHAKLQASPNSASSPNNYLSRWSERHRSQMKTKKKNENRGLGLADENRTGGSSIQSNAALRIYTLRSMAFREHLDLSPPHWPLSYRRFYGRLPSSGQPLLGQL